MKKKLKSIMYFFRVSIWNTSVKTLHPIRALLYAIIKTLILTVRFFTTKRVMSQAAALTYSTLLAIVPVMAVIFAIARGFGYNKYIEQWFLSAFESQPQVASTIVEFVNSYLEHTKSGVILGIGLIFMLYTVLMLISNVENTFNNIWQVKKQRSVFRTFTDYLAMLLLFPILIVLSSGLSLFITTMSDNTTDFLVLRPLLQHILSLLPYVLTSATFVILFVFMPNTHVKVRNAIIPGILSGIAMQWLQIVYIHSQIWVSGYNAIYGSFAALPLFMLWVQLSWTICLFGTELCYTNQNLEYYDYNTDTSDISHRYRILLSALLIAPICRRFDSGKKPLTALELRELTGIPIQIVNDLLFNMTEAGLLIVLTSDRKDEPAYFVPSENVENLTLGTMIDRLESQGKWKIDISLKQKDSDNLRRAISLRKAYLKALRSIPLKDF